jgi:hypothetical protein
LQVADLGGPQTVPIGDEDHGRVAMAVTAILAGTVHQALDLALGEVAPLDCQVLPFRCRVSQRINDESRDRERQHIPVHYHVEVAAGLSFFPFAEAVTFKNEVERCATLQCVKQSRKSSDQRRFWRRIVLIGHDGFLTRKGIGIHRKERC